MSTQKKFYAVRNGKQGSRLYDNWPLAQSMLCSRAAVKKFSKQADAEAWLFGLAAIADPKHVEVYTDGSKTATRCGIGVVFPAHPELNLAELMPHAPYTNQRAELWAAIRALQEVARKFPLEAEVVLYTDSMYTINCATIWRAAWERTAFRDGQILNQDLIKQLWTVADLLPHLQFQHVKGHAGNPHNERADVLSRDCGVLSPQRSTVCHQLRQSDNPL
jgi:ribonuclease HI